MLTSKLLHFLFMLVLAVLPVTPTHAQDDPYEPKIDPANFSPIIENPYLPIRPGAIFIYEGESDGVLEHIEIMMTNETREVMGVECVVVWDRVWEDGVLVEETYDYFAQDAEGNVWYFGEASHEIADGKVVSTEGSWEAGVDGAQPGIVMLADPEVGVIYRQEYYVGEAEDMAEVFALDVTETLTSGVFEHLLVTNEWSPLTPDVAEHKYYAEGIGLVLEEVVEGGEGRIELTNLIVVDKEYGDNVMGFMYPSTRYDALLVASAEGGIYILSSLTDPDDSIVIVRQELWTPPTIEQMTPEEFFASQGREISESGVFPNSNAYAISVTEFEGVTHTTLVVQTQPLGELVMLEKRTSTEAALLKAIGATVEM